MEPQEALGQINEIRQQMAQSQVFRGYRSLTVGVVGVMGIVAAVAQPYVVPSPEGDLITYLGLWVAVAVLSVGIVAVALWRRVRATGSPMVQQLTLLSADRLVPPMAIGALLTLAIYQAAPEVGWMLPGLWSFVFSLGVFASSRQLPKQAFWVGVYFALCGFACLLWGRGANAYSPWQMGVSFGGGMLISAAVLYWTLERNDDSKEEE